MNCPECNREMTQRFIIEHEIWNCAYCEKNWTQVDPPSPDESVPKEKA